MENVENHQDTRPANPRPAMNHSKIIEQITR
jgi:hypothetical protein